MLLLRLADQRLSAAIDPLALFLIIGAGLMLAGLIYAIFTPDRHETGSREDNRSDPE